MQKNFLSLCVISVTILLLMPTYYCYSVTFGHPDPSLPYTEYIIVGGEKIKIKDKIDLSHKDLKNIHIHREYLDLYDVNFEGSNLSGSCLSETEFCNCSFKNALLFHASISNHASVKTCDFTDALIAGIHVEGFTKEQLTSTASYRERKTFQSGMASTCFYASDFRGVNFSGIDLSNVGFSRTALYDCDFTDAVIKHTGFGDSDYPIFHITLEQLQSTRSFKEGELIGVGLQIAWPEDKEVDFSGMILIDCFFDARGLYDDIQKYSTEEFSNLLYYSKPGYRNCKINLTDSVITRCNFSEFPSLTLKNVKSTWNYKHNRMEGIKLPTEIQKALDAEKKKQGYTGIIFITMFVGIGIFFIVRYKVRYTRRSSGGRCPGYLGDTEK